MVVLGTPLAYLLARGRLPLARLVELGILLPLMLPPLVIGLLLVFLIGPSGTLGGLLSDIHLTGFNTFFALIVAEFYEAAPFYVLGAHAAFASVDPRIEQDAALLGDRPMQAFVRITLPLAAPGLATGLATAWARAMGAFGAVIIIAYYPRGLPNQIFIAFQEFGLQGALPFALLLVVAALPLPVLAYLWSARSRARVRSRGAVTMSAAPLLQLDLEVERRQVTVKAAFGLEAGQRLAIFGTSGAGKTTILESIAGLTSLNRGTVRIEGNLVAGRLRGETTFAPRNRKVALVRQPTTLFPHLTVEQNVAYAARHSPAREGVAELLERLELTRLRRARGAALSGGQRQRVALGRALASPFRVPLLDEPFSAVDVAAREAMRLLAIETSAARDAAGILVTHDLTEAQAFSDQLGIIDGGAVLQMGGSRDVVLRPDCRRVAELVGYGGFVPVTATSGGYYAIHPDRVLHGECPDRGVVLSGTVVSTRPFGPRYECTMAAHSGEHFRFHTDEPPPLGVDYTVTALDPPIVKA